MINKFLSQILILLYMIKKSQTKTIDLKYNPQRGW